MKLETINVDSTIYLIHGGFVSATKNQTSGLSSIFRLQ